MDKKHYKIYDEKEIWCTNYLSVQKHISYIQAQAMVLIGDGNLGHVSGAGRKITFFDKKCQICDWSGTNQMP